MTFWEWLNSNWTKILGTLTTMLSTVMALIASGSFEGLLDPIVIKWLSIIGIVVGAATAGVGFNNSAKVKVAEAMQTAINATPPKETP